MSSDSAAAKYLTVSVAEQRIGILKRLGMNESRHTALSKSALNSLHAYLTGEFYVKPGNESGRDGPDKVDVLVAVARECGITTLAERNAKYQRGEADSWREMNKHERARVLATMDETGDCRDWSGRKPGELGEGTDL